MKDYVVDLEMHESVEGESFNDDALFGSGVGWYGTTEVNHSPEDCRNQADIVSTQSTAMDQSAQNAEGNNVQMPSENGYVHQPQRSSQPRTITNCIQPGTLQEVNGAMATRDPVVRNKTTKNKENKIKNINQKKQNSVVNESDFRSIHRDSSEPASFRPELRVKRYDAEPVDRRNKNSVKEKKQSKNSSIAHGMSEYQPYLTNGVNAECSYLVANGINPNETPKNVSKIYVKQNPTAGVNSNQRANRVDSTEYSLTETFDSKDSETAMKLVDNNSFSQIKNDLWGTKGKKKKETNKTSLPSLPFQAPSLTLSFANSQEDLETDEVPNRSPAVLSTSNDPMCQNPLQNPNIVQIPIVSQYGNENGMYQNNNQRSPSVSMENGGFALSLNGGDQAGQQVYQDDSLLNSLGLPSNIPTSLYFGEGDNDCIYAHQLQQRYDREREDMSSQSFLDSYPDELYNPASMHNEPRDESEEQLPDHIVSIARLPNDLYEVDDHSVEHIHVPFEMESEIERCQRIPSNDIALPSPDVVQFRDDYRHIDQRYPETAHNLVDSVNQYVANSPPVHHGMQEAISLHGTGGGRETMAAMDDETFARMLQEQLNLEDITSHDIDQDEEFARHLQQMEDDHRYRSRGMGERNTHQPLHTRYGHTWDRHQPHHNHPGHTWSRPLRVGAGMSENVYDSRPRGHRTWDRPLRRGGGGHGGNDFAFLDNIHSIPEREGYDIPPTGDMYPYEYDPDYVLDEHEDYMVSINRDPRMLASLLMERAPDMMVPNDIDLNDYEALWELAEGLGEVRRVGMEQAEISLLPVHTYQPAANADSENSKTDCLVCLNTFSQGEQLRTLPCCHIYHLDCIDEWLKRNAICPVCRQSAKQGEH